MGICVCVCGYMCVWYTCVSVGIGVYMWEYMCVVYMCGCGSMNVYVSGFVCVCAGVDMCACVCMHGGWIHVYKCGRYMCTHTIVAYNEGRRPHHSQAGQDQSWACCIQ